MAVCKRTQDEQEAIGARQQHKAADRFGNKKNEDQVG